MTTGSGSGCRAWTAVPFFGNALLTAFAGLGAVGALVVMRRRT